MAKKNTKTARKKSTSASKKSSQTVRHDVVVRVQSQNLPAVVPTTTDLSEPIREGKKLTIPKTWLSEKQITRLVETTPPQYVYKRPAKGGGTWDYVTVSYVQRVLDYAFGFNWDFEILEHGKEADHVWVKGKLTIRNPEGTMQIVKSQFGRSEVKHKSSGGNLDYGNDLKAAASDSLKKCASMLGIARDIYGKTDYKAESGREPRPITPKDNGAMSVSKEEVASGLSYECHGAHKSGCPHGSEVDQRTADYSKKVYGKILCRPCQSESKPVVKK